MKKIKVKASTEYDVNIGVGLSYKVGEMLNELDITGKIGVISDDKVFSLYGDRVITSIEKAGYVVKSFVFPNGEQSKNLVTVSEILSFLAENEFTRTDTLVALGGGVVGDITGFSAGIYLRGVKFVQVPTTLLAAVDSSVGGKTGVDLPQGKNLAGVFKQPVSVICDSQIIEELPKDIYTQGMAEVIKYGVIRDKELFENISEKNIQEIISRSVEIKRDIVEKDEFDNGERQLLNLGHTFGHAVEKLSDFKLSHGESVAIGMVMASRFAEKTGVAKEQVSIKLEKILKKLNLPTENPFDKQSVFAVMAVDKKRRSNTISLILPRNIGDSVIKKYSIEEFKEIFYSL